MKKNSHSLYIAVRWLYQFLRPRPKYYHRLTSNGLYNGVKRDIDLVVSLTSFPARIKTVSYTIESVLEQDCKPDKVVLWLAEPQFPNGEKDLPKRLLRLKKFGLEICWTKGDIRSYKKLIPALVAFPESVIVTIDDDVYYPPTWLGRLYTSYISSPEKIHCHRGNVMKFHNGQPAPYNSWCYDYVNGPMSSLDIVQTGVGGVLYPPHCLYKDVTDSEIFMSLAHDTDDLWFWAMAVLQGTQICVVSGNQNDFDPVYIVNSPSLWGSNIHGHNDEVLARLFAKYPDLMEKVKKH